MITNGVVGLLAASGIPWLLFAGRLVTGLGVGVTSVVAPVLLSEVASPATRGFVTTLHQVCVTPTNTEHMTYLHNTLIVILASHYDG